MRHDPELRQTVACRVEKPWHGNQWSTTALLVLMPLEPGLDHAPVWWLARAPPPHSLPFADSFITRRFPAAVNAGKYICVDVRGYIQYR